MNKVFIITYLLLLSLGVFSQEKPQDPQLQTELKVKQLIEKKAAYNRLNNGEYDGYRVKIHFGADKTRAREIKAKFIAKFSEYIAYEDYDQPNFIITIGDFRTKLEAYEAKKKIEADFPGFIVKSKIRPMKL